MSERVVHIGEVSERCRSKTVSDRHSSDTVSESERCSDTVPTPYRSTIGVGEVLRYHSDTVSESERCSDTIPTHGRSRDRSEISINSNFIQHISVQFSVLISTELCTVFYLWYATPSYMHRRRGRGAGLEGDAGRVEGAGWAQIKAQSGTLCSVCPCSAQFGTLCARALFRNVQPHSVWPHSARPHSFGHAGVGPHSSPIIAQSGTRSVQCAHALLSSRVLFTRSVHALCSETFGRILFGRILLGHTRSVMLVSVHTVVQS